MRSDFIAGQRQRPGPVQEIGNGAEAINDNMSQAFDLTIEPRFIHPPSFRSHQPLSQHRRRHP